MDDLISRQDAIDAFKKELTVGESNGNYVTICSAVGYEGVKQILESLPSAQPERKNGKWIDEPVYKQTMDGKTWDGYTYCSECREMHEYGYRSRFCPTCGTDMRGEQDG